MFSDKEIDTQRSDIETLKTERDNLHRALVEGQAALEIIDAEIAHAT